MSSRPSSDPAARVEPPSAIDTDGETLTLPAGAVPVVALAGEFRVIDPASYERGAELARGGMGRIVAAHDLRHDRPVALKEPLSTDPELIARFRREALITAGLQHPAIVPIYEAGQWPDGRPFFAMRRVDGRALDQVIRERTSLADRLPLLATTIAVCDALAYAHMRGVVHRDLKPHNVLVGAYGETVVIDWGLARRVGVAEPDPLGPRGELPTMTLAGGAVGTPAYMAPEQARGGPIDERTDVYALGALLYHVLGGQAPYDDTEARAHQLVELVAAGPPTPLATIVDGVPPELAAIVDKAMARDPDDRYRSASELAGDLRRFGDGRLVGAHRYSVGTLLARWARRHRLALAVAGAVALASLIGAALYVRGLRRERARTAAQRQAAIVERGHAERAAARAEAQTRTLLTEHGRQRLAAGRPLEAAAYLARAYQLGDDSPTVRTLLGLAMPSVDALVLRHGDGAEQTVADVALDEARGRIYTASWDRTIGVWDLSTGAPIARWKAASQLSQVAVLPDGAIVTGGHDGAVTRWAPDTGATTTWGALPRVVLWLELGADGRYLAASSFGGATTVFEVATGRPVLSLMTTGLAPARLSADGHELVAPGPRLERWDLARGHLRAQVATAVDRVAVAADGRVAGARDATVRVWDRDGALIATRRGPRATMALRWLDRDLLILWAGGTLERWDLRDDAPRWTVGLSEAPPRAISVAGERLFITGGDGALRVLDVASGVSVGTLVGHDGEVYGAVPSADGARLVSFGADGAARRWTLDAVLPRTWTVAGARAVRFDRDGRLVVATTDGVQVLAPGAAPKILSPTPTDAVVVSADGAAVIAAEPDGVTWYPLDGGPARRHATAARPHAIAGLADGRVVIAAGDVTVWDPRTDEQVPLPTGPEDVHAAVTAGDHVALTGGQMVVASDLAGGHLVRFGEHTAWISALAASGDGGVLSGDTAGTVWTWAVDGSVRRRLPSLGSPVTALAGEPGGARVFAGSTDGGLRVWDAASGRLLATLAGPRANLIAIDVAADGRSVATLDERGTIRVWPIAPETRTAAAVSAAVAVGAPFEVDDDGRLRGRDGSPR